MRKGPSTRFTQVVLSHLRQMKGRLLLAILCVLGFSLTGLLAPWPLKIIFDHVLLDKPLPAYLGFLGAMLPGGKVATLLVISSAIVLIALLRGVFSYSQLYIASRIGYEMVYTLRRELFVHLQQLSLSFHHRSRSGELFAKVISDTNALKDVLANTALTFAADLLLLIGMFAIMFALNWQLTLIALATLPVLSYVLQYLYRKIKASARTQRRKEGRVASRVSEMLSAVSLVQAFGREHYEGERFETESAETLEESIQTARMEAAAVRSVEIISAVGTWAVILLGALQVLKGQMTPGDILIFAAYVASMYKPIRNLAKLAAKFSKAMVSAERIAEILDMEPAIQDDPHAIRARHLKGEIIFDKVSFGYGDSHRVLNDVSFRLSPSQRTVLLGASGSGKSTIVSLILRLYDPQAGSITIDGVNIKHYQRDSLRRAIGVVPQNSVLFGTTIKENIAYGKLDATMEEIIAAAKAASVHDFISELEHGYETIIGERGATLSGGQQQRIAIARAFIRNAPILILDEPMTGLDVESEAKVREALTRLMVEKTCLLITHDLEAAAEADRILVLEEGRIVERVRHGDFAAGSLRRRQLADLMIGEPKT
jgi:ATP-binding cassette, subfamily B, bacterial